MSRGGNLPFPRGKTYYEGNIPLLPSGSVDLQAHIELEGKTFTIEDIDFSVSSGAKPYRTGKYVTLMVVRNVNGSALLPKLIAKMKTDGSAKEFAGQIMGYATTVGELGYPIDEFLPAAGVANNDLFYVVIGGPAKVTSAASGTTTLTPGLFAIPTTGGKVVAQDMTVAAGTATFAQIQGAIGRAIENVAAINTDFLIDVTLRSGPV